ncbi:MAG: putative membrane protein [Clostridium sp. Maddingley MBC34-26]|nr:MAG: putative membrane protein [Clostridium sp. Maddingley MBC34-26]
MKIGAVSGCHQMHERSFSFKGYQFPVCARCTGIYIGHIVSILLFILKVRINLKICGALILIMSFDGLVQLLKVKKSTNFRRLITGILAGIGLVYMLIDIVLYFIY